MAQTKIENLFQKG